ncbi:MAG TPA: hypothetical protein VL202_19035 [Pararhizobium sp.]|uniref:hypothetical protein n=1 Tax=Pararhizobium sp. TaxID=1977563 RepID=UPI002B870094|nr:hypothetical protein [Pararhizobium sp.]HTO33247.1 hypothetical protein [Pararhizobium sp.]
MAADFACMLRGGHKAAGWPLDLQAFLDLPHLLISPKNDRFGHVDMVLAKRGLS